MKRSRNTTFGGRRLKAIGLGIAVAVAATGLAACGGGTSSGDASGTVSFFSWDKQETMQPVLDEFQKVTPELLQKTAQEWLRKTNRTILVVNPGAPAKSASAGGAQ